MKKIDLNPTKILSNYEIIDNIIKFKDTYSTGFIINPPWGLILRTIIYKLSKKDLKQLLPPGFESYPDPINIITSYAYIKDSNITGFIGLEDLHDDGSLYITIAVLPKYRKLGIASKLMKQAEEFVSKSDKYNILKYVVYKQNKASIKLAESRSYKLESVTKTDYIYSKEL